jgi:carbamoyl-phosphate synthase small subunit
MNNNQERATLILEDGSIFSGYSFGYLGETDGEVVFNTGMVGYPETLTDPSYAGQILVATYPLIGNYGVPAKTYDKSLLIHFESDKIQAKALIVSDYSKNYSHWNAERSLSDWMIEEKIPGIFGIDTRALTRKLRDKGTMLGWIIPGDNVTEADLNRKVEDPNKTDLVGSVCTKEVIEYEGGKTKIVLVDCGVKNNIIRAFQGRDISVIRVPYDYDFMNIEADGVMISNGPGDPKMCPATIENTKLAMDKGVPTLGVCLGSQIIGLAAGMDTYK